MAEDLRQDAEDRAVDALLQQLAYRGTGDDDQFINLVMHRIDGIGQPLTKATPAQWAPHVIGAGLNLLLILSAVVLLGDQPVRDLLAMVLVGVGFVTFLFADPIACLGRLWHSAKIRLPGWLTWSERALGSAMTLIGIWMLGGL